MSKFLPDWSLDRRLDLQDGKFVLEGSVDHQGREFPPRFPGYIQNKEHPFTFCNSLTYYDKHTDDMPNIYWAGTDSKENFEKNKKIQGPDWKYNSKQVVYNVNESGYRTYQWKDVDWRNAIFLFGCSCTYGVGLAEDEVMSSVLEKLTGKQVVNLGFPGGSNHVILNNLVALADKVAMPYAVVILWTGLDRYRHYLKNDYIEMGPWYADNSTIPVRTELEDTKLSDAWYHRFSNRYHEMCESYYIAQTAKVLCRYRTNLITGSFFDHVAHATRADKHFYFKPEARDFLHPGAEAHHDVAKYIYEQL
jgi:hypothetical protein